MKFLALLFALPTVTLLQFLVSTTVALADATQHEPASTEAEHIQPISPDSSSSSSATIQAGTLEQSAEQINQNLDGQQPASPQLRDLLDLPDGMIIRGSSRGGLGIGTEY